MEPRHGSVRGLFWRDTRNEDHSCPQSIVDQGCVPVILPANFVLKSKSLAKEMTLDVAEGDVISLLQKFRALQEERTYSYNLFHEGHKIYLASGPNYNFPRFRQLVHDVTQEFKRISEGMIELEEKIRPIDPKLASVIQHMQEAEKTKLQLTARQQLAMQKLQEQAEPNHDLTNELAMIRKSLITVTETVNDCCEEVKYALQEYTDQDRGSEGSATRKNSLEC